MEDEGPSLSFALFLTAGFPGEDRSQRDTPEEGAVTALPSFPALSCCLWGLLGRVMLRNGWGLKNHNDNTALLESQPQGEALPVAWACCIAQDDFRPDYM